MAKDKEGYCPICNKIITAQTDANWIACPVCGHHITLKDSTH